MEFTLKSPTVITARSREAIDNFEIEKGLTKAVTFDVFFMEDVNKKPIGAFTFNPMPGCCGVVISTGSYLRNRICGGRNFHRLKEFVARELGYSRMLATVETSNFPELIGAAKNGWKLHEAFNNKRTNHQITVMEKAL